MSHHYKVHFPTCGCRYNKTNRYQIDILDRKTKRYEHKFIDNNLIDEYLKTLETYSVCIHAHTPDDQLNGGIIFIIDEKHSENLTHKFNKNKEIDEIKLYSISELKAISDSLTEYSNFTPIKDSLRVLNNLDDNYSILICVQKDFDGNTVFSFPKGKRFIHETSVDCAYREFEEEIGFSIDNDIRDNSYQRTVRNNSNNTIDIPLVFRNGNFLFQIILS